MRQALFLNKQETPHLSSRQITLALKLDQIAILNIKPSGALLFGCTSLSARCALLLQALQDFRGKLLQQFRWQALRESLL